MDLVETIKTQLQQSQKELKNKDNDQTVCEYCATEQQCVDCAFNSDKNLKQALKELELLKPYYNTLK